MCLFLIIFIVILLYFKVYYVWDVPVIFAVDIMTTASTVKVSFDYFCRMSYFGFSSFHLTSF